MLIGSQALELLGGSDFGELVHLASLFMRHLTQVNFKIFENSHKLVWGHLPQFQYYYDYHHFNYSFQTAQQAKNQNDVNKAGIRDLDRFIKEVDGEANGTALNAAYAEGNASKALTEITTALGNLTGMTSITTDSAALSREAAELKQQAEALNTKVIIEAYLKSQVER